MDTATAAAATIQHPKLGTVRGKAAEDGSGITQFLGIKYASLKDRFAPPELVEGDPEGTVEAREFGPHVICLPNALDMELSHIQQKLPSPPPPPPPTSDVDGLNLNITVPPAGTPKPTPAGFPVLVFIHGGGLFIGANWWPQYDFKRLVKLGVERGLPFVGVNVGYRLGIPGFLTSAELRQHSYLANNGLRDQAAALRWVRAHIAGFGGDPANVTAMGESAGGTAPTTAERTYTTTTAAAAGLADLAPDARVAALRSMPAASLLAIAAAAPPAMFVRDGDVVLGEGTHEGLAGGGGVAS
ncbi:hypothetical protein SLS58_011114 [Diplodia intermedia]|uniref:Carboxylesterase type B domain-containing protein n=1 Tax=Diplodia intermedia TaxID=856260 RepID=A0ABR3T1F6_9PEZI